MEKQEGKKLTKKEKYTPKRNGLPIRPPQAPPGGGDVPDGIQNAGGWGDGRGKI